MNPQVKKKQVDAHEEEVIQRTTTTMVTTCRIQQRGSTGSMPSSINRPTRKAQSSGRDGSSEWNQSQLERAQPSGFGRTDFPEPQMDDTHDHAG